jgi:decaprenyl-phosphate phosphoribosyltransferase
VPSTTVTPPLSQIAPPTSRTLWLVIRTARPKQWVKNAPIGVAVVAAGLILDGGAVFRTLIAIVAFCLVASGGYFVNDAVDAPRDRLHPTKRFRPIAAGLLARHTAVAIGACLAVGGLLVSTLADRWALMACLVGYAALTASYSYWLKEVPILDMAMVAGGFVIRAIAGAAAVGVVVSEWFFLVALFGALLVVAGKRADEAFSISNNSSTRAVMAAYPESFLTLVVGTSAGAVILTYCMMAFERSAETASVAPWFQASILPFVLVVLRYCLMVFSQRGGEPSELLLGDRQIQVMGVLWLVLVGLGATL